METVVDNAVRVIHSEKIVARKHFEHSLREVEVYGGIPALRTGTVPVEDQFGVLFLHGAFHGPGPHAVAVVVDEVGECAFFFSDLGLYEMGDSSSIST